MINHLTFHKIVIKFLNKFAFHFLTIRTKFLNQPIDVVFVSADFPLISLIIFCGSKFIVDYYRTIYRRNRIIKKTIDGTCSILLSDNFCFQNISKHNQSLFLSSLLDISTNASKSSSYFNRMFVPCT